MSTKTSRSVRSPVLAESFTGSTTPSVSDTVYQRREFSEFQSDPSGLHPTSYNPTRSSTRANKNHLPLSPSVSRVRCPLRLGFPGKEVKRESTVTSRKSEKSLRHSLVQTNVRNDRSGCPAHFFLFLPRRPWDRKVPDTGKTEYREVWNRHLPLGFIGTVEGEEQGTGRGKHVTVGEEVDLRPREDDTRLTGLGPGRRSGRKE